ncbi:uncharacterized protein LOC143004161 [Genypterus blacodes]|uniref:uncharacterized protein LOC143004161 n=1 Tax=Genypterus blacodes TaxID=154954 RepID=UPI003F77276E
MREMLDGSPDRSDEVNIGNVENNNPISLISNGDGVKIGNKPRQAMLKKGGRKLRSTAPCPQRPLHHQKAQRSSPISRLADHNNNVSASVGTKPSAPPVTGLAVGSQTVPPLHHLKSGTKKELLKSKGGRLERGAVQPGSQPAGNLARHDQMPQNVNPRSHRGKQSQAAGLSHNTRKKDCTSQTKPALREQKRPLHASDNVKIVNVPLAEAVPEDLKDGEKVYAGAKFSEPPSPSVLPKPPSHWVGENELHHSSQSPEQMTVHLKSLLKVQHTS